MKLPHTVEGITIEARAEVVLTLGKHTNEAKNERDIIREVEALVVVVNLATLQERVTV